MSTQIQKLEQRIKKLEFQMARFIKDFESNLTTSIDCVLSQYEVEENLKKYEDLKLMRGLENEMRTKS